MTGKRARRSQAGISAEIALTSGMDAVDNQPHGRAGTGSGQADSAPGGADTGSGRKRARRAAAEPDRGGIAASAPPAADSEEAQSDAQIAAFVIPDDAVVRRTKDGWRVGSDDLPDLTCAMILADLLAAETGMPAARPEKPQAEAGETAAAGETGRLRATVGQLEHALLTRIRVEQAIGVLAERHRIKPRQAFEQLRDAARSRGRRVIDIAGDVVASATNPLLQLPDELSRPRAGHRRAARQSFGAQ